MPLFNLSSQNSSSSRLNAEIIVGAQASGQRTISIQVKNSDGSNISTNEMVSFWLSRNTLGSLSPFPNNGGPDSGFDVTVGHLIFQSGWGLYTLSATNDTGLVEVLINQQGGFTENNCIVVSVNGIVTASEVFPIGE